MVFWPGLKKWHNVNNLNDIYLDTYSFDGNNTPVFFKRNITKFFASTSFEIADQYPPWLPSTAAGYTFRPMRCFD